MLASASRAMSILALPPIWPHMEPDASSTSMDWPGPCGARGAADCAWAVAAGTSSATATTRDDNWCMQCSLTLKQRIEYQGGVGRKVEGNVGR